MIKKLLPLIPNHRVYAEAFGGAANLLLAKDPEVSEVEVYNDIDAGLINFFRVMADKERFRRFYEQILLVPYSREEFYHSRDTWKDETDEIIKVVKWFVVARQSFSGTFSRGWGYVVTTTSRGMAQTNGSWLSTLSMLPDISARLQNVIIEHDDFRNILAKYDAEDTFFYLDPPYVLDTRIGGSVYENEMSLEDHQELVQMLLRLKAKIMVSGYDHEVYKPLEEAGWTKLIFSSKCYLTGRTKKTKHLNEDKNKHKLNRIECVWLNYVPAPHKQMELLDVKYGT